MGVLKKICCKVCCTAYNAVNKILDIMAEAYAREDPLTRAAMMY